MTTHARFTTPYGFSTTDDEVLAGIDLTGKRVVITGGASGVGAETARALAAAGAEITLAVRQLFQGQQVAQEIAGKTGNARITAEPLDLADRASVAAFVERWDGPLDILINNAGIMALPELHRTPEGWELQFATNFLGHFHLTHGLHDALTAADGARVVSVSSNSHRTSPIVFDDIMFDRRPYDPWLAYGQSKTADILLAVEIARRWAGDGIIANALMPGGVRSGLQRHQLENITPEIQTIFDNYPWKTPEQGAATSVLLAASPLIEGVSGRYFEDCNEAEPTTDPDAENGVRPHALDPEAAAHLWDVALKLVNP